jgi:hypothetical protein
MSIHYATVNSVRTTKLWNLSAETFQQIVKQHFSEFKTLTEEERDNEKLIIGWEFVPHHKAIMKTYDGGFKAYSRCHDNVIALNLLILDVDNDSRTLSPKITFDEAVQEMQGISCYFYTSFNHKNPNKGDVDRFRIVVEIASPISLADYQKDAAPCVGGALQRLFPWAARESFKPSQPFYMPVQAAERKHLSRSLAIQGEPLDWTLLEPALMEANGVTASGHSIAVATAPTLRTSDAFTSIKLTNGTSTTVGALYATLQEGYHFKKPCYSTIRDEKRPSSFAFREGRFLIMQDFGSQRQRVKYEIEPAPMKSINDVIAFLNAKKTNVK